VSSAEQGIDHPSSVLQAVDSPLAAGLLVLAVVLAVVRVPRLPLPHDR
jgi:hypothetical protein